MEGDIVSNYTPVFHVTFQSTPSAWRETAARRQMCQRTDISIHSLRMEGDASFSCNEKLEKDFNPLPPHGGRHPPPEDQPTPCNISIHSLRMEGDTV